MNPPRPSRSYWICQVCGWGAFTVYVLTFYVAFVEGRLAWDYFSIIVTNALVCPAISHQLRSLIYRRGWLDRPPRVFLLPLAVLVVAISFGLTAAVFAAGTLVTKVPVASYWVPGISTFFGFAWAFTGWLVIYFAVQGRRRREALLLQLRIVTREGQLRALRAQVNPHFLFNSLNSLRHLIVVDPNRAVTMVTGLAELLRYSLASDRIDTVPLADELAIVDEYLALEQVRLEDRLRIERDVDPSALTVRIPPMLVQSLVDNAIKHGVATLPEGGLVRVQARTIGPMVELTIANSGTLTPDAGNGSGLTNARERLRLLFDGAATLTIEQEGVLTVARVRLPVAARGETRAAAPARPLEAAGRR